MLISLADIKVKRRVRHKAEDLDSLMESMRRYGLLNPVTLNSRLVLIAGERRLEAAKLLGWHSIDAVILDETDPISELEIEIEENTTRSPFTDQELMEAYTRLERLRNPGFFARFWRAIMRFFSFIFSLFKGRRS